MRATLLLFLLGLLVLPLRAEDWTTNDGKTYHNVQVRSHDAAYVTILDEDGGARIPLSTLSPALQKRFDYDPAKAAPVIAATKVADEQDKVALAAEKKKVQAEDARRQQEAAQILAASLFAPPPDSALFADATPASQDVEASRPIASEPPTQIDDWDSADYGYDGYGDGFYPGYGYYPYGYGSGYGYGNSYYGHGSSSYRNYLTGSGGHSGMHSFSHR